MLYRYVLGLGWPYVLIVCSALLMPGVSLAKAASASFDYSNRMFAWHSLLAQGESLTGEQKVQQVNQFFNQFTFVRDASLWSKSDYWATPREFVQRGAGDCEDFAIAKYFALLAQGVNQQQLYIAYVQAQELNQAHMVLLYLPEGNAEPIVLDNLTSMLLPLSERIDLLPYYAFNEKGLWLLNSSGLESHVGDSDGVDKWGELLSRVGY